MPKKEGYEIVSCNLYYLSDFDVIKILLACGFVIGVGYVLTLQYLIVKIATEIMQLTPENVRLQSLI